MITKTEILPSLALRSFIRCYTVREFDTMGKNLPIPLPAKHELSIAFTLRGDLYTYNTTYKGLRPHSKQHIIGLQTAAKGSLIFNGDIRLFTIQFRPNGFYQLFGIPSQVVTENAFEAPDVIPYSTTSFQEQLIEAKDLSEIKRLTDEFLLSKLVRRKHVDIHCGITLTSLLIFKNHGNVNIKQLAYDANMSLKRFETNFIQQVGIPPKLFARITRFNYALAVKRNNMSKSWTDISHFCGYYDQMHFIKEFKEFAGASPVNFYKTTPLPLENYKNGS